MLAAAFVVVSSTAASGTSAPAPEESRDEMFPVQLVMLKTGPESSQPDSSDPRQSQHLAGLEALVKSRQALIAGPIQDGGDLRGLVVLDVPSADAAQKLLADDPWLASGHLVAEYHTWFVAKRWFQPLRGPFLDVEPCTLALLVRPSDAPQLSPEELSTTQAGHLANMAVMADAGALAIAGPFEKDTPLRGVFVFRGVDRAKIDALVANDPAVARGRLKLERFTWWVSRGLLPEP